MRTRHLLAAAAALLYAAIPVVAQDKPKGVKQDEVDRAIERGCDYLRKQQQSDGSWNGGGGSYPTTMTAIAGLALLMEGSTPKEGKYSDELSKAVAWFLTRSQNNGLLGNPQNPTEGSRYIYGHGFGMLFLACVYGEEEDAARRKKLEALLKKAVEFSGKAQTRNGGWGYVSASDGNHFDEGSTTITQLQGLRACRNAGIVVPKEIIDKSVKYLKDCTTSRGGLVYNYSGPNPAPGGECQAITAAACACAFSSGNYEDKYAKMWIKYCKDVIYLRGRVNGHDEYQNYYFAQVVYVLGDDRYQKLFPDERKESGILWSDYKKNMFEHFLRTQGADGGWQAGGGWGVGPIFATGTALMILQLEKNIIPFYHR